MIRVPDFELHAGQVRLQSGAEIVSVFSFVEEKDSDAYLKFVNENYEDNVKEGHMIRYGNLDRFVPIGYSPNYTLIGPNGFSSDTMDRPFRMPFWHLSPRMSFSHFPFPKQSALFLTCSFVLDLCAASLHTQQ